MFNPINAIKERKAIKAEIATTKKEIYVLEASIKDIGELFKASKSDDVAYGFMITEVSFMSELDNKRAHLDELMKK